MKKVISSILLGSILLLNINTTFGQTNTNTATTTQTTPTTTTTNSASIPSSSSVNGITINSDCLLNGQCKYNIYDTLNIRNSVRSTGQATSVGLFIQDIVLSATFFIGTIVTVALMVSGIMYIFGGATGNSSLIAKANKGITGSIIGLILVASSYIIIRLIQYIAKGF